MEKTLKYISLMAISIATVTVCLSLPRRCGVPAVPPPDRDTVYIRDTACVPVIHTITEMSKPDTVLVPAKDTLTINDTVYLVLPISQRHYHYPDTADVYISGYMAMIDSIKLHTLHYETVKMCTEYKRPIFGLTTGTDIIMRDKKRAVKLYIEGMVTIKRRFQVRIGGGIALDGSAAKGFMYGGVAYIIK